MLLHKQRHRPQAIEPKRTANLNTEPKSRWTESQNLSASSITSATEEKEQRQQPTMLTQGDLLPDFIALRTVPVMLKMVVDHCKSAHY